MTNHGKHILYQRVSPSHAAALLRTAPTELGSFPLLICRGKPHFHLSPFSLPYCTEVFVFAYVYSSSIMWFALVCVCVCSVAMATAQHISDHRTALGLKALPGFCQSIIHARGDMSEGKGRRVETAVRRMHARAHTHTPLSLHTHWISSYSSWLETPMAIAIGIHSPRMLGQLCRYWMRLSWFGLFCMQLEIKTTWYLIQIYIPSCQNTSNSSSLCLPHHTVYWILHKIDRHFLEIQQCPHHGLTKSDGKCSKNIYQQNLDMSFKYSWYVH